MQRVVRFLRSVPKKHYVYLGLAAAVVFYGLNFLIPKQVLFNYAGQTCSKQLTILPGLQKSADDTYDISFKDTWNVGSAQVASLKTCFSTKNAPKQGSKIIGTALFNGPIARTLYSVNVAKAPSPQLDSVKANIPISKALRIGMSTVDSIHNYSLTVANKMAACTPTEGGIQCDIPSLNLTQGESFKYDLVRSFRGGDSQVVGSGSFKTLRAVTVTQASVTPGQTVYARPTKLSFTADKPIVAASVLLTIDGKTIALKQSIEDRVLKLTLEAELPREKAVELVIKNLEAVDGSGLVEPYKVPFVTSGGPKVASVSVGATGVAQSASIILTFDQPLSKTKDVASFVSMSGGQASIQKRSDTQVAVQLNSLPLCQVFTITAKQGIPSEHDIASSKAWSFTGRTACYQTTTYGTSLRGRPLTAYIFGSSGPVTMYVGGIHGNEPSSSTLMKAWVNELEANPGRTAGKRIVVIPSMNPDGLAAGTRTNSRGVNLNRNFPTDNWIKSTKDTDGSHESGGGEAPLSEPEASALAKLTTSYQPRLLLSFHAVGSLVIGNKGGYSAGYSAKYASMVGYRDGTNDGNANFDYDVTGAYEDWAYWNASIPAIVIELSSYGSVNSAAHYKALWAMLE